AAQVRKKQIQKGLEMLINRKRLKETKNLEFLKEQNINLQKVEKVLQSLEESSKKQPDLSPYFSEQIDSLKEVSDIAAIAA
ncbi:hypothetical protein ACFLQ1_02600, partial [Candidatus Auribacterota bacterium]